MTLAHGTRKAALFLNKRKSRKMAVERVNRDEKLPALKLTAVQYGILLMMLVLVGGLWRLQVLGVDTWRVLAEQNRIRKVPILAPRGKLFDREGRLLVDNYPSVSCFLVREQGHDYMADLPVIARGLNMTVEQIEAILKKYRTAPKYQPLPLKQDITPDEQEFIEAHRDEFPELETVEEQRRLYPKDGFAAHVIGYVGEVSEDMLNNDPKYAYYEPGDVVGKSGVEQSYDALLRGQDGSQDVVVDSHGREVGKLGTEHAVPGKSLKLTIDIDIQRAAENALGDCTIAIAQSILRSALNIDIDRQLEAFARNRVLRAQLAHFPAVAIDYHVLRPVLPAQQRIVRLLDARLAHHIARLVVGILRIVIQHIFADLADIANHMRGKTIFGIEPALLFDRFELRKLIAMRLDKFLLIRRDVLLQRQRLVLRRGAVFLENAVDLVDRHIQTTRNHRQIGHIVMALLAHQKTGNRRIVVDQQSPFAVE